MLRDYYGTTHQGITALFIAALQRYHLDPSDGIKDIIALSSQDILFPSNSNSSYNGYELNAGAKSLLESQFAPQNCYYSGGS